MVMGKVMGTIYTTLQLQVLQDDNFKQNLKMYKKRQ